MACHLLHKFYVVAIIAVVKQDEGLKHGPSLTG